MLLEEAIKVLLGITISFLIGRFVRLNKEKEALCSGLQMVLRLQMIAMYEFWCVKKKYAPIDIQDTFSACYECYHSLGKNGVMDSKRDEFLSLPTHKLE